MKCNVSQTKPYIGYAEILFFLVLFDEFHGVFSYSRQHDQQQRKYQYGYDLNIRGYQLIDSTRWHHLRV